MTGEGTGEAVWIGVAVAVTVGLGSLPFGDGLGEDALEQPATTTPVMTTFMSRSDRLVVARGCLEGASMPGPR